MIGIELGSRPLLLLKEGGGKSEHLSFKKGKGSG